MKIDIMKHDKFHTQLKWLWVVVFAALSSLIPPDPESGYAL